MNDVLIPAGHETLYRLVGEVLLPVLQSRLEEAQRGQRLRVTTLPPPVMVYLCEALQGDSRWCARLLSAEPGSDPWRATPTKLIELRNNLDQPLLVFLPPGQRTAAEDSLDIATFHELALVSLPTTLAEQLLQRLPEHLRAAIQDELGYLRQQKLIRNADEIVEYLLTIGENGSTASAAGAAVYLFGLIPDYQLFVRGNTRFWLSRNINACRKLTDAQPMQASVLRLPLKPNTIQKALAAFLRTRSSRDVRSWAKEIACDAEHRLLSLDQWEFAESGEEDDLRLIVNDLSLPRQTEDLVAGAAQLPVLNLGGKEPLKVSFRSLPAPNQSPAWKTWRVQIIAVRDGTTSVAWESNSFPKPAAHSKVTRNIKTSSLEGLDEGTYYFKVDAYDADGALLTKPHRVDESEDSRAENESDRFLVVDTDVPTEERDTRAVFVPSLLDSWLQIATKALGGKQREAVPDRSELKGEWDVPVGAAPKGEVHFVLRHESALGYSVVVPAMLRKLEREILLHPELLGLYTLSFVDARTAADVEIKRREAGSLGAGTEVDRFLKARKEIF